MKSLNSRPRRNWKGKGTTQKDLRGTWQGRTGDAADGPDRPLSRDRTWDAGKETTLNRPGRQNRERPRREIRELTAEPAWRDPWKDVGNLPDYSHVREQLLALLTNGHADR